MLRRQLYPESQSVHFTKHDFLCQIMIALFSPIKSLVVHWFYSALLKNGALWNMTLVYCGMCTISLLIVCQHRCHTSHVNNDIDIGSISSDGHMEFSVYSHILFEGYTIRFCTVGRDMWYIVYVVMLRVTLLVWRIMFFVLCFHCFESLFCISENNINTLSATILMQMVLIMMGDISSTVCVYDRKLACE